jgi:hypothetical protein
MTLVDSNVLLDVEPMPDHASNYLAVLPLSGPWRLIETAR